MDIKKFEPNVLVEALLRSGRTQEQLARELGVTQAWVSYQLSGKRKNVPYQIMDTLRELAQREGVLK